MEPILFYDNYKSVIFLSTIHENYQLQEVKTHLLYTFCLADGHEGIHMDRPVSKNIPSSVYI